MIGYQRAKQATNSSTESKISSAVASIDRYSRELLLMDKKINKKGKHWWKRVRTTWQSEKNEHNDLRNKNLDLNQLWNLSIVSLILLLRKYVLTSVMCQNKMNMVDTRTIFCNTKTQSINAAHRSLSSILAKREIRKVVYHRLMLTCRANNRLINGANLPGRSNNCI